MTAEWSTSGNAITPDQLIKRLKAVTDEFRSKGKKPNLLAQVLFQVAKVPELKARELAPEDSGRLKRAIRKKRDRNPQFVNATENYQVYVYPGKSRNDEKGAWYWQFAHFPTEKNKNAVPFLTMAFEGTQAQMLKVFELQFRLKLESAEKRAKKLK